MLTSATSLHVQCLWRCRDFRDSIVQLNPAELPNDEGNREL